MKISNKQPAVFVILFLSLFTLFYYFNIWFFAVTMGGSHANGLLTQYFNYIHLLRLTLLHASAMILRWLGYTTMVNEYQLMVVGRGIIQLIYSCLGLGLMSFFAAFVLAFPSKLSRKLIFLFCGLILIQLLNVIRFVVLALYWKSNDHHIADHHTIFNLIIYILIAISLYFWVRHSSSKHAKN